MWRSRSRQSRIVHTDLRDAKIGNGNFNQVFKVLKRIDGCMFAVKHSLRQLHQETERRKALMEVQASAALGYHEKVVGYFSSWFENEHLYIQLELCDHSLSINKLSKSLTKRRAQIVKALQFLHKTFMFGLVKDMWEL